MNKDTQIALAIREFIDSEYAVDDPSKGFDCLNCLVRFFVRLGWQPPAEFEGWTLDNYGKRALADPQGAHRMFERFVVTLGREIDRNYMLPGDLLVVTVNEPGTKRELGTYAGIYLGNGNAFFMFDKGGRVAPWAIFVPFLKCVRRLID
jgi:hypothetical protein